MGMPDKFSFKPLPTHTLIAELNTYFINVPLDLFYPPFAEPDTLSPFLHTPHMVVHGI